MNTFTTIGTQFVRSAKCLRDGIDFQKIILHDGKFPGFESDYFTVIDTFSS
jgi:hypothetical protein